MVGGWTATDGARWDPGASYVWPIRIDGHDAREMLATIHPDEHRPFATSHAHAIAIVDGHTSFMVTLIGDADDLDDTWHAMKASLHVAGG